MTKEKGQSKGSSKTFAYIARRSYGGASYLVILVAFLIYGPDFKDFDLKSAIPALSFLFVFGVIVAQASYECWLPVHRSLGNRWVLKGFHTATGHLSDGEAIDYAYLRTMRTEFLDSGPPSKLTETLERTLEMRQFLTYLAASAITGLLVTAGLSLVLPDRSFGVIISLVASMGLLVGASVGHRNRCVALGNVYGAVFIRVNGKMKRKPKKKVKRKEPGAAGDGTGLAV